MDSGSERARADRRPTAKGNPLLSGVVSRKRGVTGCGDHDRKEIPPRQRGAVRNIHVGVRDIALERQIFLYARFRKIDHKLELISATYERT